MLALALLAPCSRASIHLLRSFPRARARSLHAPASPSPPAWTTGIPRGSKVTVAMSGGVDSSVVLALLASTSASHNLDLDLRAVFMRNWSPQLAEDAQSPAGVDASVPSDCAWEKDWEDVRRVCAHVGGRGGGGASVRAELVDLSNAYWMQVFEPAVEAWQAGRTPNPDVGCNREIKFGALMRRVLRPGEFLATGHYAAIDRSTPGRTRLLRARDPIKDQSYYLSSVPEAQLARAIFPLADLAKTRVRELAREYGLPTAEREESMGVCFIGERGRFGDFVAQYAAGTSPSSGPILASDGTPLGTHAGLWHYTIGQRARLGGMERAWYVARKDVARNAVVVVPGADHPALMCEALHIPAFSWVHDSLAGGRTSLKDAQLARLAAALRSADGLPVQVQVRHRMRAVPARARYADGPSTSASAVEIIFPRDAPCHAVAEGQVAAVWVRRDAGNGPGEGLPPGAEVGAGHADGEADRWEWCLGSGVIGSTRCAEEV